MWKAKVTRVSEVDAGAIFEINFEILIDGVVRYPNFTVVTSSREDLRNKVIEIINRLKAAEFEKVRVRVGDEITL